VTVSLKINAYLVTSIWNGEEREQAYLCKEDADYALAYAKKHGDFGHKPTLEEVELCVEAVRS
jgi:hypothetical protein